MKKTNKKIEELADQALAMLQTGASVPEILNFFPEQRAELQEILETAKILRLNREAIQPPSELKHKLLKNLAGWQPSVTSDMLNGYLYNREAKGRSSKLPSAASSIEFIMSKWNSWLPIGAIVVAIIVVAALYIPGADNGNDLSLQAIDSEILQLETLDYQIDDVVDAETSINDVDAFLSDFTDSQSATPAQESLDLASINEELKQVDPQEIDNFFQEEDDLKAINSGLDI